ncbi:glutamate-rich protein 6B [Psammomys obesus]|uniref:glutamate-rich protein 6B n=1 Tax=Psammomys obesus TaxID=48139 RepID=UPI002452EA0C|nr:glutamate-rich protein 6B [Psammomys obesus]
MPEYKSADTQKSLSLDLDYWLTEDGFFDLEDTESMEDDDSFWDEYLDEDEDEKTLLPMYPFKDSFVEEEVYLKEKEFQKHLQKGSDSFIQGTILNTLMNDTFDRNQEETLESISSTYDSMFMEILNELAVHHKLEEDLDMPQSKIMESNSKRKLGILLKKSFEKYRQTLLWIVKKRRGQKLPDSTTTTFMISDILATEKAEAERLLERSALQRRLVPDKEWIQTALKEHEGDGQSIPYHSGIPFNIFFPDGTGQIYYPSGNLALLISYSSVTKVTYIVLEDCVDTKIRGFANSSGHVTFNDETGKLWLSLSKILGYYFPINKPHKAWNWWNLSLHVHAPPVACITLKLNKYIHIEVKNQDTVMFYFCSPKQKRICFNMGARFKSVRPKILQAMKRKSVLETDPRPMSWKIQALLGKISRQLSLSTLSELEDFIAVTQVALEDLNAKKSRIWS